MKQLLMLLMLCAATLSAQYSLEVKNRGGASRAGEQNQFSATLYRDGVPVRTIERSLPFDVPFPSAKVHPQTGTVVLSYVFDGFVEVYDRTGSKQWEQQFFKEMSPNYERTITVALGKNTVAFLTSDVRLPQASVHKYAVSGDKEWQTELPFGMGYEIVMSADERTIAAGSYIVSDGKVSRSAVLLDAEGVKFAEIDLLFRSAAFSEDGTMLALASTEEIALLSIQQKKELYRFPSVTGGIIHGVLWHNNTIVTQEAEVKQGTDGVMRFVDPTILRFTTELKEIGRKVVPGISYKKANLRSNGNTVEFSADAERVRVIDLR